MLKLYTLYIFYYNMNSYREMVLVPHEEYNQFRKQLLYQNLPHLTRELYDVRERTQNLPADQRILLEGEVLRQKPIPADIDTSIPVTPSIPTAIDDSVILNNLKTFPRINKNRANQIYQHLKSTNIKWNEMGQMLDSNNDPIPYSNIVELIDYITNTKRSARAPEGLNTFLDLVVDSNLPRNYLSTFGKTRVDTYKLNEPDEQEIEDQPHRRYKPDIESPEKPLWSRIHLSGKKS